jgi:hypothetical protein
VAKIWTTERQALLFSIYIPPTPINQAPDEISIQPMLNEIESSIRRAAGSIDRPTTVIMAGDFSRHHPTWGNNTARHAAIEHAEEIISFFQKHGLHSCLPRGTPTFWSLSHPGSTSTIDLTVTNTPESLIKCRLYHDHYGSDHRATYSEWSIQPTQNAERKPRKAYD